MIRWINTVIGDRENHSLEMQSLNGLLLLGVVITVISMISNYLLIDAILLQIITLGAGITFALLLYCSRVKGWYQSVGPAVLFLLISGLTPGIWLTNGGSEGASQYPVLFIGVAIVALSSGWQRAFFLLAHGGMILTLFMVEHHYPEYITPYQNELSRMVDVGIGLLISIVGVVLFATLYIQNYQRIHQQKQRYLEEMEQLAIRDGLTGVFNRRHIMARLGEIDRAARHKGYLFSVAMIDIDHFKQINDTRGHPVGDRVLIEVAEAITQKVRRIDLVGRYGGEEFLLILSEGAPDGGYICCERIREKIESTLFLGEIPVTVSIGIASFLREESIQQMIDRADQALYRAKKGGRNRVCRGDVG